MKTDWDVVAKSAENALGVIKAVCHQTPAAAVILGSGVNAFLDVHDPIVLPFEEIFGVAPTIAGHAGSLTIGRVGKATGDPLVAIFRGRYHLYEGHEWSVVTLPSKVVVEWGIPRLLLTNAAGGLNQQFQVGDLMVFSGYRDLLNPNWQERGLLPAIMQPPTPCSNSVSEQLLRIGKQLHEEHPEFRSLQQGVYSALLGPSYETLAEIEMLRRLGSDAVGMSTVPELQTCAGTSTKAAAISVITNVWVDNKPIGGHLEVLEASRAASARLDLLFKTTIKSWGDAR